MRTYRPLTDDEEAIYRDYTQYAFNPSSAMDDDGLPEGPRTLGARRGLFLDDGPDRPVSVCAHHWFEADVRGSRLSTPGLSAVATPPEFRRRGHVRALLANALEEYRDGGHHVSILWPFSHAFYRRLGWGEAQRVAEYEIEPEAVQPLGEPDRGRFHAVGADDVERVAEVYRAATRHLDLAVDRSPDWWRHRVFESWDGERHVYGWSDDAGALRGYVVYSISRTAGELELAVADTGATDAEAYRQIWGFLGNHDSQMDTVRAYDRAATPLLDVVERREGVSTTLHSGLMARVVDAETTLGALSYPADVEAAVTVDVEDRLVDWHDRPIHLAVSDGAATVERSAAAVDVTLDVATLSSLVVGARPVRAYARAGRLDADSGTIATLEALFPPRRVHCRDSF